MRARPVGILVAVVLTAGVVVAGLATSFAAEDTATLTPPGPIRGVEVDVESGHVWVAAGAPDTATVTRTRRYVGSRAKVEEAVVDGVLRVRAVCRLVKVGCEADYTIRVPAGASVRVRTDRGAVTVAGTTGMVDVGTGAGSVRLDRTRGPVKVTTWAGAVDGVDLVAPFLDATTGAGRVRLTLAEPPGRLGLRTGAGAIDVGLPPATGGYRVDAKAGAGKVEVSVEQNPGGDLAVVAESGAGRIRIHPR